MTVGCIDEYLRLSDESSMSSEASPAKPLELSRSFSLESLRLICPKPFLREDCLRGWKYNHI